ncbi:MAG: hypothetical protein IPK96_11955 [Flammeovirgaceae bacterium]|nr:hypothetical protein [Flammeovirgaceae bacterium]
MRGRIIFLLAIIFVGCSQEYDAKGIVYSGNANLKIGLSQFIATNAENENEIILNMTGPHELTFNFNNKISHIDYEKDVIIFKSETGLTEWTAKKVKGGFELNDGTIIQYGNCKGWTICIMDDSTKLPILKGKYSLNGNTTKISLWISDSEMHVELLGFMANGLLNRSRNAKQKIDTSFETVIPQVWTY